MNRPAFQVTPRVTPIVAARAVFDAYAALDAPDLPADPWSALQVRYARWEISRYGLEPLAVSAAHAAEEAGELAEALVAGDGPAARDALADVLRRAASCATGERLDLGVLWRASAEARAPRPRGGRVIHAVVAAVGRLCRAAVRAHHRETGGVAGKIVENGDR